MATDGPSRPLDDADEITGEEDLDGRSTPNKDLASAVVLLMLAVLAIVFSLRLDVPGSLSTAPGLLPFITGLTLLLMSVVLAVQAVRAGAEVTPFAELISGPPRAAKAFCSVEENRRTLSLAAIVIAYVLLVAFLNFDLRFPTPLFDLQISSYEVISVIMVTWILRLFWKAPVLRCLFITLVTVEMLASVFRYGFGILMPESF